MSVSKKIRGIMVSRGIKNVELAKYLGISEQAVRNKIYRDSLTAADLIKIADFLGCELAFIVDDKQKIVLDMNDLKKDK